MIVNTSIKKENNLKKKTAISEEQFTKIVKGNLDSRLLELLKAGKKVTPQLEHSLKNKVVDMVNSEYRVKGSRAGHINKASVELQTEYNSLKEQAEKIKFTCSSGVKYVCTLLCKKANTEKVSN